MNIPIEDKWLLDETWQRVVDNELTPAELGELVEACEQNRRLWKCCAVAFLQEQAFQNELTRFGTQWNRDAGPTVSICDELSKPTSQNTFSQPGSRQIQPRGQAQSASALNSLALAASVLLAFLIGWQASKRFGVPMAPAAEQTAIGPATGPENQPAFNNRLIARQSPADANDPGGFESLPATAIDSSDTATSPDGFNQVVLLDMPRQLAVLQQQGLVRIETTEGFLPVQLIDGNTAVVPVQQFDVHTVKHTY